MHRKIKTPQAMVVSPVPPVVAPPVTQTTDTIAQAYEQTDTVIDQKTEVLRSRQRIHGYFAISSYSNFSDYSETNSQKMKYTFSLLSRNIGNTNLSAECYVSFVHNDKEWSEIKSNIFNGLKIYNLALNYDFEQGLRSCSAGRSTRNSSNMGPNDGLQFELKFKPVSVGIIAGFRPDYEDFGFNADLFQFGGYSTTNMPERTAGCNLRLHLSSRQIPGRRTAGSSTSSMSIPWLRILLFSVPSKWISTVLCSIPRTAPIRRTAARSFQICTSPELPFEAEIIHVLFL
ncbi:MAG: hypothetical protein MZV63_60375 [Marinilabiliales bacterium]|nr:hypothetical protein [Marinilabiliales bacterium]